MTLLQHLEEDLPLGWRLTHLIRLDPDWQAIIADEDHVAVATGDDIASAIARAVERAIQGQYSVMFNDLRPPMDPTMPKLTLAALGLAKPPPEFKRRV